MLTFFAVHTSLAWLSTVTHSMAKYLPFSATFSQKSEIRNGLMKMQQTCTQNNTV